MDNCIFLSIQKAAVVFAFILLLLINCSGGFDNDSPNAVEFEQPIFGSDSLH